MWVNFQLKKCNGQKFVGIITKYLKSKLQLKQSSKLIGLNPFLDDECVLQIGGRLKNADLPDDTKHPIVFDGNSIL
jgi:hypothetical protein